MSGHPTKKPGNFASSEASPSVVFAPHSVRGLCQAVCHLLRRSSFCLASLRGLGIFFCFGLASYCKLGYPGFAFLVIF